MRPLWKNTIFTIAKFVFCQGMRGVLWPADRFWSQFRYTKILYFSISICRPVNVEMFKSASPHQKEQSPSWLLKGLKITQELDLKIGLSLQ